MSLPSPDPQSRAVVTGASSGIGRALAVELAARGYNLIVAARRGDLLDTLAGEVTDRYGVQVEVRVVDLSDRAARGELSDEIAGRNISILCNNAGIATFGAVADLDATYERAQVELNAVAVHDLTLAVLPGMLERATGGILVTGSAAGNMAIPNNATYAATKAFANTFTESLHGELRGSGVHVTLLAPGPVRTEVPPVQEQSIVDRLVPDALWISNEITARGSLDALAKNRMRYVPGLIGKGLSLAGQFSPRSISAPIAGAFYGKLGAGS